MDKANGLLVKQNGPVWLAILTLLTCTQTIVGQITVALFGGNYVKKTTDLGAMANLRFTGDFDGLGNQNDQRLALGYTESLSLAPSADYTGPAFYGAYQCDWLNTSTLPTFALEEIQQTGSHDHIRVSMQAPAAISASVAGFLMFPTSGQNGEVLQDFSLGTTGGGQPNLTFRFLVRSGLGYYVSQSTFTTLNPASTVAIENETWAAYQTGLPLNTGRGLNFDQLGATFSPLVLSQIASIDRIGIYFENDLAAGLNGQLSLSEATLTYAPVPEADARWWAAALATTAVCFTCVHRRTNPRAD